MHQVWNQSLFIRKIENISRAERDNCGLCNYLIANQIQISIDVMVRMEDTLVKVQERLDCVGIPVTCIVTGSMFLGTNTAQSDIDVLVTGPEDLTEEVFITRFIRILNYTYGTRPKITNRGVFKVLSLFVESIKVDMTYVRLLDSDLTDPPNLTCLCADKHGPLLTSAYEYLQQLKVQNGPHLEKFQLAVRCIKTWAQAHDLCGNIRSIPTIAWTMMVSRAFIRVQAYTLPHFLLRFFQLYASFPWNERAIVWMTNKKQYSFDRTDRAPMEVQLPYEPYSNITAEVPKEKFDRFIRALGEAADLLKSDEFQDTHNWNDLFRKTQ